jgi:general secretion pathway protein D
MEEREEENVTKVPLFGDIPLLGWLFKNKSIDKKKTNLLVFLTPHIVRDSEQLSQMTERKKIDYAKTENTYKQGELFVKFKENTDEQRIAEIISSEGASIISAMKIKGLYLIMLKKGQEAEDAAEDFNGYEEVEYAEPNYIMKIK